jgi:transcription antitermination factor NusA-like protein
MKNLIQKIESKILTKLFMRWIDKEYDLELLAMTRSMIQNKEVEIKSMIDYANKVEIKGYKRYDA